MASIKQRGDSYTITVCDGYDYTGKKITRSTTYHPDPQLTPKKRQKAVEAFAIEFEKNYRNKSCLDGQKITLAKFVERWLEESAVLTLQPGTVQHYKAELNSKILPKLGHLKLAEIKVGTVNSFLASLTKNGARADGKAGGYSKGSIAKTHTVLSSILRTAVEWELIPDNPCLKVHFTSKMDSADKIKYFTPQQTAILLNYIEQPYFIPVKGHSRVDDTGKPYDVDDYILKKELPEQIKCLFQLAIFSGLRNGEILALTWDDLLLSEDAVLVTKAVSIVNGKTIIKSPKTRSSKRKVAIPHRLTLRLNRLHEEQQSRAALLGDYWKGDNWIFTQDNGSMMSYSTPYHALQDIIDRYNIDRAEVEKLPKIPFHGLRHTNATLMISDHEDLKTISARLGHAETSTTLNIYAHALLENQVAAANRLETLIASQPVDNKKSIANPGS